MGRAAGEEAEHEVGTAGLAPVVVQRHDVGMFEPGNELRLGLEPLDELRLFGELGADHLDRDLTIGAGLGRREHPPERALTEHLVDGVAAQRPGPSSTWRRGCPTARSLQRDQLGRRLESGLVGQPGRYDWNARSASA